MSNVEWTEYLYYHGLAVFCSLVLVGFISWLVVKFWNHYPVNCWFCNQNSKVKVKNRNSWFCHNCQQYNGFSADGGYNKSLYQNMQPRNKIMYNYNKFPPRPASNGLCHKCNTNQQLKVLQLANFKPMNQNNFDNEVEQFTLHLEDVYKLCKKCKKYLNTKLQNEKGAFLNPKNFLKKVANKQKRSFSEKIITFLKSLSLKVTYVFLSCVIFGICWNANLYFSKKIIGLVKQYVNNLSSVVNYNYLLSYKYKENAAVVNYTINSFNDGVMKYVQSTWSSEQLKMVTLGICLETLTLFILVMQVILFMVEFRKSFRTLFNVCVWTLSGYLTWTEDKYLLIFQPILVCVVIWNTKASTTAASSLNNSNKVWKNMKNLSNSSTQHNSTAQCSDEDELISEDSDFDDPAIGNNNRTSTPEYQFNNQTNCFSDARSQIPPPYGFRIGHFPNQSKSSQYHDSPTYCASQLDKDIGTLNLGNKSVWSNNGSPSIFSPSYYNTPSSNLLMCSPTVSSCRPVLSPSRFVYSTQQSWVAGGYWGTESPKKIHPSHDTSRSSSQSSGFESMASGNYKKGYFLPSRIDDQTREVPNHKSDEFVCDKSVGISNYPLQSGNVFRNVNNPTSSIKSLYCRTPFGSIRSKEYDTTSRVDNLLNYSFVNPNPNNSFIPLDKANC